MTEEYGHIPDGFLLSEKEIEELRKSKRELTEYGKEKLRKLIYEQDMKKINDATKNLVLENLTYDEMLEEAERREKSNRVLQRYNDFYNMECAGLPHGTPITPEHQQMIAFQSMIDALRCEHLNQEYNFIAIADIEDLIERLDEQATDFLQRTETVMKAAQERHGKDLDTL